MLPLAERLKSAANSIGVQLELATGPRQHLNLAIQAERGSRAPARAESYYLGVDSGGVVIQYRDEAGLRAAIATLRQLLLEFGRRLPRVVIKDYPDFARRGVMLDISRGRVPNLDTLLELVNHLADYKINEFQLYTEHTFAYRNYEPVWREWSALTGEEILQLDARCRQLGIDLVPNQNSFGHLRPWLEYGPLKELGEVSEPYEGTGGDFLRYPSTLAPNHPGTMRFLRELFEEMLPHFTSKHFNVGCDETWDLGRGRSKRLCEVKGKGRVYVDFLKRIHSEVSRRGRRMMFWGDIILHYPELIKDLPKDLIALNWGYEASHPFQKEARLFARSRIPFYVCPGTSSWMSLVGRHDNAFANLRAASEAGQQHGAKGYLNTDWGDGGHPQPLVVSYAPFLMGAALSWCARSFKEPVLERVLSREIFHDPTGQMAKAALRLGQAHRKFNYVAPNVTPFGTVIAAPPPAWRELVCRDGLKYYARIAEPNIRDALETVEEQRAVLADSKPNGASARIMRQELDMAARMAAQSCQIMLWQQALAAGKPAKAKALAKNGMRELADLEEQFNLVWPIRNKGTPIKCSPFLKWRLEDYRLGRLHFSPESARRMHSERGNEE